MNFSWSRDINGLGIHGPAGSVLNSCLRRMKRLNWLLTGFPERDVNLSFSTVPQ